MGSWRPLLGSTWTFWTPADIPYRGKGIAPYIRYLGYKELERLGRTRLYSISIYFNTPAVNFKKKLGAEFLELRLRVRLFRKWERDVRVKKY
jgi:hypothetical protein